MKNLNPFNIWINLLIILVIPLIGYSQSNAKSRSVERAESSIKKTAQLLPEWSHVGPIRIDSVSITPEKSLIQLFFSNPLSYIPVRAREVAKIENRIREKLNRRFKRYQIEIYTDHHALRELIPNSYRTTIPIDSGRLSSTISNRIPVVQRIGSEHPSSGLYLKNIALWDSHGWYYESKLDRWEWQRARLFGTVEDISTMSFVLPYLVPMLENSGASVFLPRERDWQSNEVIVDQDRSTSGSEMVIPPKISAERLPTGFLLKDTLISGDNPFQTGTSIRFKSSDDENFIKYIPFFKIKGRYSVSVSYRSEEASLSDVQYTVYHTGGKSDFLVNQKIGGGTWIYLGTFDFDAGKNPETGMVTLGSKNEKSGYLSADAVKFGGGMGNVARRPAEELLPNIKSLAESQKSAVQPEKGNPQLFDYKLSGKPRYVEAARYYLQSSGFPDTLTYHLNKDKNDYNDDYQSRGKWVNYLTGDTKSSDGKSDVVGLKIPVDLAFALHTDAGVTPNDSIIGTLAIYSTAADHGLFPNGKSRLASRDLSDLIQTQLVEDIRQLFNPLWTRRGLWDKQYSEAWRPNVPTMLLELFSHQNIADVKYGLDPRFRFAVGRSIYKGMLRFLSVQENRPYVVQPLPVDHFAIRVLGDNTIRLSWQAVKDPLEPSAIPKKFKVYQRLDENGFDNGLVVNDTVLILRLPRYDQIFSFKVTAINDGGESFPGETLAVGLNSKSKGNILVVNGFDRICAPSVFDNGTTAGVAWWKDQGVADRQDISFVGFQYDFARKSNWLDDDSPGWGASYGDMEDKVIPGNRFDYPAIHGKAIMAAGYSFVSVSDEVFCQKNFDCSPYFATDLILGEERATPSLIDPDKTEFRIYTPELMSKITQLTQNGTKLFISGAYIGSEFGESGDSTAIGFARDILHFTWRTGHASKGGAIYATDYARKWLDGKYRFNTTYHPEIYTVEAPDGIEPSGKNAITAFRYGENNVSAGVLYHGNYKIVVLGFPFETMIDFTDQKRLMQQIIHFFESK